MSTKHIQDDELEKILDDHAEYYIRQTMKFFQHQGESPALSRNNDGDTAALQALKVREEAVAVRARIDQMLIEADAWRIYGGKGLPPNYQPRMNKLQRQLTQLQGEATEGTDE